MKSVSYKKVNPPALDNSGKPIILSDRTIEERKQKVLKLMEQNGFSALVIYADKEHGSNFEYLTGFIPRFEEALHILNRDGSGTLILGNENVNKAKYSRVQSDAICCPLFSLPNQPMNNFAPIIDYLSQAKVDSTAKVGVVGWKLLSNQFSDFHKSFDLPHYILQGLQEVLGNDKLVNATQLYIDPEKGARVTNNAEEIAHYEYGASLASDAVLEAMDHLEEGVKETTLGQLLNKEGQYNNVVTIAAVGDRFEKANLYPLSKSLKFGDKVALTVGYKGGLSSRSGYAVKDETQLNSVDNSYLEEVVFPYYRTYVYWLNNIKIGQSGGEFYKQFDQYYPQETYGWELCPGHLTADEEWLSSPFYKESTNKVQSGNIFQIDFIPKQPGHHGVSAESTIAIADKGLREEIKQEYPDLWERIENRKEYMKKELSIDLRPEILPLTSTVGYYRPFFLNKEVAMVVER